MYEFTKINVELPEFLNSNYKVNNYMILDIETTGLSRSHDHVILVGFIYNINKQWFITQLFCDHRQEEKQLLEKLQEYITDDHLLITYNGHAFDIPFLNQRYQNHNLNYKISNEKHFDLYRVVRASKKALNLDNYKLKSVEIFWALKEPMTFLGKNLWNFMIYMNTQSQRT